ncbi:SRPBCC family protein [Skermanella aerolata]|uniref:SRPBCC family protein n=1 Tax=Skermanella aerolata TaxID=393310 RepID=UPI003D25208D
MVSVPTTVTASIAAPRAVLYEWLILRVFTNELDTILRDAPGFPGVTHTTGTTNLWNVPGATRIVHLSDGTSSRETVTAASTPDYFAYRLTEFSSRRLRLLVREAKGQWWFTDEGTGTHAKWTYTAESRNILSAPLLVPVMKVFWNRSMRQALARIKARAEKEVGGTAE